MFILLLSNQQIDEEEKYYILELSREFVVGENESFNIGNLPWRGTNHSRVVTL